VRSRERERTHKERFKKRQKNPWLATNREARLVYCYLQFELKHAKQAVQQTSSQKLAAVLKMSLNN